MSQEENPYRPPRSEVLLLPEEIRVMGPASKGRRFGTLVVDYVCYLALSFAFGTAIAIMFGDRGVAVLRRIPGFIQGTVLYVAYYMVFEGIWSRTPGKWVFGTVVTNEAGSRPSTKQVLGRTLCRFIPFEAFSFLWGSNWHDSISKTRVMRCR